MTVARLRRRAFAAFLAAAAWLLPLPAAAAGYPPMSGWPPEVHGGHEQQWFVLPHSDGYLYVGHGSGVAIFDGQRWQNISTPHRTRVRRLAVDSDGSLVASTVDDLLRLVADDRGARRLVSILDKVPEPQRRFGDVLGLAVTPAGYYAATPTRLFFMTRDGAAATRDGRFTQLLRHGPRLYVHERDKGLQVIEDAAPAGLEPLPGGDAVAGRNLGFLLGTPEGTLLTWIAGSGLASWHDGRWTRWPTTADAWMNQTLVVAGHLLPDGSLFVATQDGMARIGRDGRVLARLGEVDGLPASIAVHMSVDSAGDMWLAMHDGIGRIAWGAPVTLLRQLPAINAVVRHRGRLLVAADTELLALAAEVRPGEAPVLVRTGFNVPTWSFAQIGEELFVASLEGIQRLADPSAPPGAFRFEMLAQARFAYSVLADRTAPRVFGLTDRGLHLIERVGDRWIARDVRFAAVSGELRWLAQEGGGALWVGSTNGRALRIEPVDAGWSDVRVETFDAASGLPPGAARVFSFRGGAIVGTSHGPFVLDASSRGLVPDTRLKDLPHDASGELEWLEFTEMANGEVWARIGAQSGRARPTASGYRWDPAALAPVASEPVYDFHRDADGATWIGRSKSLVRLAPDAPSAAALPAPRLRAIRDGTGALLAQDRALEQPTLAAGLADLRFEFAWPAYALAEGARFRSRLDGHERDFSPWTPEPHRDVGGLRGGRYVLHLETMDRYGRVRSAQPHAFELPPPWYRTWWALLAWIAVGVACLAIVVWQATRWRTRRLELARASLERVVEERTAQVRNQAERLEALDLAKSGFFAGVTHEFRTPLTLILEPLRELREGTWGKLPARTATALDHIERNAQRVLALVNQLLDLQSAEAGTLRIAPKAGDLAVLTRAVAGAFEGVAARAGLTFEVQASQPAPARFDPIHMESVVANLVSNALKYTPAGGRVLVEVSPDDAGARLVVANSGPGIPAEELPRIFERFYRAPPRPGEHARGAGLGLAVVKEIVERHGGTVNATSEPGQGAEFEVVLPAVPASEAETGEAIAPGATTFGAVAALPDAPHASDGTVDAGDATTVLLVDDNVELREFLAQRLQLDYRVLQAGDGEAALSAARAHLPDVVVSDVNMPRMDGIALLRALKADPATSAIGVVLLASGATVEARAEGFSIGADDYIYKPFNTTELLARIAGLIASRTQLRKALVEAVSGGEHEAPPEDPLIARVRAAVHARLDDSAFGVAELAAELHMERTTLFKRLKALGAPAPVKLMRDIRLEAAARMLREAAGQVTEVAYACGYQSLSHFSSSFSEKFGVRPSEYLQRARSRVPE